MNHSISYFFLWFCHVLSLLKLFKRTQQPLDPFDFPFWTQVFFNECVNELRSVGLKPLEMLTLEPHFTGSAVIVAANKKPGLKMVVLWKTLRFLCVVSGLCSWLHSPNMQDPHSMLTPQFYVSKYEVLSPKWWFWALGVFNIINYSPEGMLNESQIDRLYGSWSYQIYHSRHSRLAIVIGYDRRDILRCSRCTRWCMWNSGRERPDRCECRAVPGRAGFRFFTETRRCWKKTRWYSIQSSGPGHSCGV